MARVIRKACAVTVVRKASRTSKPSKKATAVSKKKPTVKAATKKAATKVAAKAAKVAPKVTKKVIAKKPVAPKAALTKEEKELQKLERERMREERNKIKEERARIRAEKEAQKLEKLRMWELVPTTSVAQVKTNPYLTKTASNNNQLVSNCCIFCNNRAVIQAATNKDSAKLKTLLADHSNISNPFQRFGMDCSENVLKIVVRQRDFDSFKLLIDYLVKNRQERIARVKLPQIALTKMSTGHQNTYSHNFPMRQVKLSRGGKEGNNAFTYDKKIRMHSDIDHTDVLKLRPPMNFVKYMMLGNASDSIPAGKSGGPMKVKSQTFIMNKNVLSRYWAKAVRKGNYPLVKQIFEDNKKQQMIWFSRLHQSAVLQGKEANEVKMLNRNALLKQSNDEYQIVPAQIACINPDPSILQNYFRMYPTTLQTDSKGRDLIHYAVMNDNPEILEFLLSKRQMVNNADMDGITPLMLACKYGKLRSVQLLIQDSKNQKKALDKKDKDFEHYEKFYSYVDGVGPYKNTPLHFAMRSGQLAIVKALVEGGATVDLKNFYNDTPLSVACQLGHFEIAEYLIQHHKANIHGVDKQQRTPLIRACQNGQIHIVSMLLRRGVNANFCDLSENTALHHACAYGWLNIVKLLVEQGKADVNRLNEWKSSPTIIAMLKGHFGIVDYLLSRREIDASLVDDQGRSLVAQLCLHLTEDSFKNLKFLIQKNKINVSHKTVEGYSPLHILACNNVNQIAKDTVQHREKVEKKVQYFWRRGKRMKVNNDRYNRWRYNQFECLQTFIQNEDDRKEYPKVLRQLQDAQIKCAELLIKNGCSVDDLTTGEQASSPVFFALQNKNHELASFLLKQTTTIEGLCDAKNNAMHMLANDFTFHSESSVRVLREIAAKFPSQAKKLIEEENADGFKPLHLYYSNLKDLFQDYQFLNALNQYQREVKDYAIAVLDKSMSGLNSVVDSYSKKLNFDISCRVGLSCDKKEEAKELLDQGGIKKATYEKLLKLELASKNDKEKDKEEETQIKFKESGFVIDTRKREMAIQIKLETEEEQSKSRSVFRHYARRATARKVTARRKKRRRNNDSDESEEDNGDNSKKEFDPGYYYDSEYCLKNNISFLIKSLKLFQQRKSQIEATAFEKINQDLIDQIIHMLNSSAVVKNSKQNGFNQPDKKGDSVLSKALKHKMIKLANRMIESGSLDLTAQQKNTGLTPMHLIAFHIDDIATVQAIFKDIDVKQTRVADKFGNTPLHYAAIKRNLPMCQMLCEYARLDVNARNQFGCTPLHMSLFAFNEKMDHSPALERYLLSMGADALVMDSDKRIPLVYLFFKGQKPEKDAGLDPANILQVFADQNMLAKTKHLAVVDRTGNTLLHYACMAGATICAMSLIQAGSDVRRCNIIGNTPFAMALCHGQQQICAFMIPNGHCAINPVYSLRKASKEDEAINELKGLILPEDLHQNLFVDRVAQKSARTDQQIIDEDYTVEELTPIYLAMFHGWDGVGFLLQQMRSDRFESLTGCLKAQKYGKFLDLLSGMSQDVVKQVDSKGRNLLLIMMRHLSSELDDKETQKVQEVITVLTRPVKKQPLSALMAICDAQKGYGISIESKDNRGNNILHTLAKYCQSMFKVIIETVLTKDQTLRLLSEKSRVKWKASPLVLYALVLSDSEESSSNEYIKLLEFVKTLIGAKPFKDLNWTYQDQDTSEIQTEIPDYLQFDRALISDETAQGGIEHVIELLLIQSSSGNISDANLNNMLTICQPFLEYKNAQTGETLLMTLVKKNINKSAFNYLLGAYLDEETKKWTMGAKARPRVNLNAQDNKGCTALHYAIQPSESFAGKGFRQDTETIKALLAKGASPSIKNRKGFSPVDLAKSSKTIIELFNTKSSVKPQNLPLKVKKLTSLIETSGDRPYNRDADAYLAAQKVRIQESKMQVDNKKPECPVDDHEDLKNCEVVQSEILGSDGTSKLYFDTVMIKIDIKASYYGVNSFYVIQLLHDKAKDLYLLWTRWGRIGDFGQYQRTPFPTLLAAQLEFAKVFRQKSGNKWEDVINFENLPKKYKLRRLSGKNVYLTEDMRQWETAESEVDMSKILVNFSEHTNLKKSNLSSAELEFIKPLVDSAYVIRRMKKYKYNDNLVFEGLLDRRVLQNLYSILTNILATIKKQKKAQKDRKFDVYSEAQTKIFDLTNQFYELSTPTEFAFDKIESLDYKPTVIKHFKKLQRLRDLEQASQLLMAAAQNVNTINPYEYCFRQLSCRVKVVPQQSDSYQLLMRYINSSMADNDSSNSNSKRKYNLQNIYEIAGASNQSPQLFENLHQHMMLFHGTSKANLISILEQGLQIKPQNAAMHHGSAFGEGIYLADNFNLAANYSEMATESTFYVLVCEVALGNVMNSLHGNQYSTNSSGYFVDGSGDYARGYHSVRVMGRKGPDFNQNWVQPTSATSEVIWPIGDNIDYPNPYWRLKPTDSQEDGVSTLKQIVEAQKPKPKKKKKVVKRPAKYDSEDEDMDEDEDEDDEATEKEAKIADKLTKVRDANQVMSSFEANEIHHFVKGISAYWSWQRFNYNIDNSQYVIANQDQVRVKYIVQVRRVTNSE